MTWYWWIVIGLALAAIEIVTVDLIFIMLVVGAIAGAITALATDSIVAQALVAAGIATVALLLVRPIALRHLTVPHSLRTGTEALVGAAAYVVERVDSRDGRVKIGGEIWSARTLDPKQVFEPGSPVEVAHIDGATAIVHSTEP